MVARSRNAMTTLGNRDLPAELRRSTPTPCKNFRTHIEVGAEANLAKRQLNQAAERAARIEKKRALMDVEIARDDRINLEENLARCESHSKSSHSAQQSPRNFTVPDPAPTSPNARTTRSGSCPNSPASLPTPVNRDGA